MHTAAEPLVAGRRLRKRFGDRVAVDAIDFRVEAGEAFGFLGPNGAGKTTTMRMIGCVSPVTGLSCWATPVGRSSCPPRTSG